MAAARAITRTRKTIRPSRRSLRNEPRGRRVHTSSPNRLSCNAVETSKRRPPSLARCSNSSRCRREVSSATRGASAIIRSSFSTSSRSLLSRRASSSCFWLSGVAGFDDRRAMQNHCPFANIQKKTKRVSSPKTINGSEKANPICIHCTKVRPPKPLISGATSGKATSVGSSPA